MAVLPATLVVLHPRPLASRSHTYTCTHTRTHRSEHVPTIGFGFTLGRTVSLHTRGRRHSVFLCIGETKHCLPACAYRGDNSHTNTSRSTDPAWALPPQLALPCDHSILGSNVHAPQLCMHHIALSHPHRAAASRPSPPTSRIVRGNLTAGDGIAVCDASCVLVENGPSCFTCAQRRLERARVPSEVEYRKLLQL